MRRNEGEKVGREREGDIEVREKSKGRRSGKRST